MNAVYRCTTDKAKAASRVSEVVDAHSNVVSIWYEFPSYSSEALETQLDKSGYKPKAHCRGYGMEIARWQSDVINGFYIRRVENKNQLMDFFDVCDKSFGTTRKFSEDDLALHLKNCKGPRARAARFVVYDEIDDSAVGAAGLTICPKADFGLLWAGCTIKSHRGRGVYRMIIDARIAVLRARKISACGLFADIKTSAPIVSKLKFHELGPMIDWQRTP